MKDEFERLMISYPEIGLKYANCLERFRMPLEEFIRDLQKSVKRDG